MRKDKTEDQKNFELFCEEYNLEYDFNSYSNGYYMNWQTNQALAIYKHSDYMPDKNFHNCSN